MNKSQQYTLFLDDEIPTKAPDSKPRGAPRVKRADRSQLELRPFDLESTLTEGHTARLVWDFVLGLDLSVLYNKIRATEGQVGRSAIDPVILMSLWMYATIDGVGSARALARLCEAHDAYRWICGGVSVNHHTLSDFRVDHGEFLDSQLTASVAALMAEGLVAINRVAQDGVRVRASAGAASFRRKPTLEECLKEAEEQIEALKQEVADDPAGTEKRRRASRERAAQERLERVSKALKHVQEVEEKKKTADKEKARASTTDPEARVMKMPDGGFRPAFNGQFASDTETMVILGVDVDNSGSDQGKMSPMVEQLQERYGQTPSDYLIDGGFANHDDIEKVSGPEIGCTVYAPVQTPKDKDRDRFQPMDNDTKLIAEWRKRMGTDAAKEIYKERAATAECVNAHARNRGLQQFKVRGADKVRTILLWFALAHNLMRTAALRLASGMKVTEAAI
jgi:transposase